jgi:hypothetical protein
LPGKCRCRRPPPRDGTPPARCLHPSGGPAGQSKVFQGGALVGLDCRRSGGTRRLRALTPDARPVGYGQRSRPAASGNQGGKNAIQFDVVHDDLFAQRPNRFGNMSAFITQGGRNRWFFSAPMSPFIAASAPAVRSLAGRHAELVSDHQVFHQALNAPR